MSNMTYTKPLSSDPYQQYAKVNGVELPVKTNPVTDEIEFDDNE